MIDSPPATRDRVLLGVADGADRAAVRAAFRRQARELHPDRHLHRGPEAAARAQADFVALNEAYRRLVTASPYALTAVVEDGVYRPARRPAPARRRRAGTVVSTVL